MAIKKMPHHYSFENPASVYDEEAMTALELAGRQGAKINEVVEGFNTLEHDTNEHLNQQDANLAQRLDAQDKAIPVTVRETVQQHIENGDFDQQIDDSMDKFTEQTGNRVSLLETRLNNMVGQFPAGASSGDAELGDLRVTFDGRTFGSAGEAVRKVTAELNDTGTGGAVPLTWANAIFGTGAFTYGKTLSGTLTPNNEGAVGVLVTFDASLYGKRGKRYRIVCDSTNPCEIFARSDDNSVYKNADGFTGLLIGSNWIEFTPSTDIKSVLVKFKNNTETTFRVSLLEGTEETMFHPDMIHPDAYTHEDHIALTVWHSAYGTCTDSQSLTGRYIREFSIAPGDSGKMGIYTTKQLDVGVQYCVIIKGLEPAEFETIKYGTQGSWGAGDFATLSFTAHYNASTGFLFVYFMIHDNSVGADKIVMRFAPATERTISVTLRKVCEPSPIESKGEYVTFCGDSLTAQLYSNYVETAKSKVVFAVGGEGYDAINLRTGIIPLYYLDSTIKPGKNAVNLSHNNICLQGMGNMNPVTIAGIQGTLYRETDGMYFTPAGEIEETPVYKPVVIPYQSTLNDVLNVYWTGTNNLGINTAAEIFAQWEMVLSVKPNTLIVGLTNDSSSVKKTRVAELDTLGEKLGARYLPVHDWLVEHGIEFCGLTPNSYDSAAIAAGNIPPALLSDTVHFNEYGKQCIAHLVSERMRLLGID